MSYAAPGKLEELTPQQLSRWNDSLSALFDSQIELTRREVHPPPAARAWIYNPITNGGGNTREASISWTAFPKRISDESPTPAKAWERADNDRNNQEEYCEWEVVRDPSNHNKVVRVTFTCETEDYFTFLASEAPDLLLALYRKHVSTNVQLADLIVNGNYVPQNKWNFPQIAGAHGILMHMAQGNNTFGAAVNLVAIATWPRVDGNGNAITGEQALISCRPFGDHRRHSDPHIGAEVNALVRAGNEIAFAGPVGLYMDSFDTSDWETPDGLPATDYFRVVRGSQDFALRVVFEAPQGSASVLGDVRIGGRTIQFGGQIAETIRVRVRGIARLAQSAAPKLTCGGTPTPAMLASVLSSSTSELKFEATRSSKKVNLISSE